MSVTSLEWLIWMSATVSFFWIAPSGFRHYLLVGLTAIFLIVYDPLSLLLLLGMAAVAFLVCFAGRPRSYQVTLGVIVIVATLVYFKLGFTSGKIRGDTAILVPLGLSYYALRVIHVMLERLMGRIEGTTAADLTRYLLFLPTILAGPIHRYGQYKRDIRRHRWMAADIWGGIERIIFGYAKITVLGNFLVSKHFVAYISRFEATAPALYQYLDCVRYGANLYFQFSGYSDIAIGFALLLGFHVMENFNNPFFKKNISEFWRAWHISLTSWCREYIYTSVTAITRRPALGGIATLLVIGLWHEISLRYLAWGFYHGVGIVAWQWFQSWKSADRRASGEGRRRYGVAVSTAVTLNFVIIGFVFTKEATVAEAVSAMLEILTAWMPV